VATMGDGVADEQEPTHRWGLGVSIAIRERAKARVGPIAEHRSEAKVGIYNEGRDPIPCTMPDLGEFGRPRRKLDTVL